MPSSLKVLLKIQLIEDEQVVSFTVPKGGVAAHHGIQLRNTGTGGGDHAEISLSFTNSLVE